MIVLKLYRMKLRNIFAYIGGIMQKLSDCEEKVMLIIWENHEKITYRVIRDELEKGFGDNWKGQTVCSFIARLKKKEYIETYKVGRFTHYKVLISLEDYRKMKLEEMVEKLYQGNRDKLLEEFMK